MTSPENSHLSSFFGRLAEIITKFSGSNAAFIIAAGIIIVWGLTGPLFHYSETW